VELTLHDFYIKNFPYRSSITLHARAYPKVHAHGRSMHTHALNMHTSTYGSSRFFFHQNIL